MTTAQEHADDTIDTLRAQLAEQFRELIAKEAERAARELECNNAQRQHTMQCAINKADSQRILELTAKLAEAQKDEQRLDWLEAQVNKNGELHLHDGNHARGIGIGLRPGTLVRTLRAAIDAAKG